MRFSNISSSSETVFPSGLRGQSVLLELGLDGIERVPALERCPKAQLDTLRREARGVRVGEVVGVTLPAERWRREAHQQGVVELE